MRIARPLRSTPPRTSPKAKQGFDLAARPNIQRLKFFAYAIMAASLSVGLTNSYTSSLHASYTQAKRELLQKRELQQPTRAMTSVVVLARSLPAHHSIKRTDLIAKQWSVDTVPKTAFQDVDSFFREYDKPVAASVTLAEGEVLMPHKIRKAVDNNDLSAVLSEQNRAVTIKVNEIDGVGGFVKPGDRVDVLLIRRAEKGKKTAGPSSDALMQNIRVLAVDQTMRLKDTNGKVAKSITVAVTLQQAQKIALARTIGTLSLALRNRTQKTHEVSASVSLTELTQRQKGRIRVVIHRASIDGSLPASPIVITRNTNWRGG